MSIESMTQEEFDRLSHDEQMQLGKTLFAQPDSMKMADDDFRKRTSEWEIPKRRSSLPPPNLNALTATDTEMKLLKNWYERAR